MSNQIDCKILVKGFHHQNRKKCNEIYCYFSGSNSIWPWFGLPAGGGQR